VGAVYELYSITPKKISLFYSQPWDPHIWYNYSSLHVINSLFIRRRFVSNTLHVTLYNLGSNVVVRTEGHYFPCVRLPSLHNLKSGSKFLSGLPWPIILEPYVSKKARMLNSFRILEYWF
jgi:hypothetical protein